MCRVQVTLKKSGYRDIVESEKFVNPGESISFQFSMVPVGQNPLKIETMPPGCTIVHNHSIYTSPCTINTFGGLNTFAIYSTHPYSCMAAGEDNNVTIDTRNTSYYYKPFRFTDSCDLGEPLATSTTKLTITSVPSNLPISFSNNEATVQTGYNTPHTFDVYPGKYFITVTDTSGKVYRKMVGINDGIPYTCILDFSKLETQKTIIILTETSLYTNTTLKPKFDRWIEDIKSDTGLNVVLYHNTSWTFETALQTIRSETDGNNIDGVLLVGDIPPGTSMSVFWQGTKLGTYPDDFFYKAPLYENWYLYNTDPFKGVPYSSILILPAGYSGWLSRIIPLENDRINSLASYLDKNHNYRTGGYSNYSDVLFFNYFAQEYPEHTSSIQEYINHYSGFGTRIGIPNTTTDVVVDPNFQTMKTKILTKISGKYKFIYGSAHGSYNGLYFNPCGNITPCCTDTSDDVSIMVSEIEQYGGFGSPIVWLDSCLLGTCYPYHIAAPLSYPLPECLGNRMLFSGSCILSMRNSAFNTVGTPPDEVTPLDTTKIMAHQSEFYTENTSSLGVLFGDPTIYLK